MKQKQKQEIIQMVLGIAILGIAILGFAFNYGFTFAGFISLFIGLLLLGIALYPDKWIKK